MYSLVSQTSAPTNTIDIIGSSKQALSSSSTLLLSSLASQSRSSLEKSSRSRITTRAETTVATKNLHRKKLQINKGDLMASKLRN
jgi:hypothetical protein